MKKFLSRFFPIIPVSIILGMTIFSHSCANTTTPPTGGPKDTIPPVITEIYPVMGQTQVPTHKTQLKVMFNEYVTVKDPKSPDPGARRQRSSLSAPPPVTTAISASARSSAWR